MRRSSYIVVFLASLGVAASVQAQTPLEAKAEVIAGLFREDPSSYDEIFSSQFLSQVPPAQLTAIFTNYHSSYGPVTGWRLDTLEREGNGKFSFTTENGFSITVTLVVSTSPPHNVEGLLLGHAVPLAQSLDEIVSELEALPGTASFLLARLEEGELSPVASLKAQEQLAIGSAFKLYILSELIRSIEAGERSWSDTVELGERSLPSGIMQEWPKGAPVTLHTLAALMISRSDNTATDELLRLLSRKDVEAVLVPTGHSNPARNSPFLSTLEMFRLKGDPAGEAADRYLAAEPDDRRVFLEGDLTTIDLEELVLFPDGQPQHIDTIEWFASVTDLGHVMNWLKEHTEEGAGQPAREILAINPGAQFSDSAWSYVGFKGGSEPGVLNLTFLLQSEGGAWYTLAMTWNNPDAPVETSKLVGLAQRAVQLIE